MKLMLLLFILGVGLSKTVYTQDTNKIIKDIERKLAKRKATVSDILTDSSYMQLHSLITFRNAIRQYAKNEKIRITAKDEAGTKIIIKGNVINLNGNAEEDKLVYIYQTSDKGWYSDTAAHILENEGDRIHARLFGYFVTGSKGEFEFETIKPKGYPNSTLPAHIHMEITLDDNKLVITELEFDDDPRLTGGIRARSTREHFSIAKNEGTEKAPLYVYKIVTGN